MRDFIVIASGVGFLIAIFLVLSRADASVKIIETIAGNTTRGIAVLQGREVKPIEV